MNLQTIFENFRWAKFATPYETNAKGLGQKFLSVLNGDACEKDYQSIENNLEHQSTFYKISPWGLKFYLALLDENNVDKDLILKGIKVLFESANYKSQVRQNTELSNIITIFEEKSRNYTNIDFSKAPKGAKKVLITGFDPFVLDPKTGGNPLQSNPVGEWQGQQWMQVLIFMKIVCMTIR